MSRKKYTPEVKTKAILEVLKERKTANEIAKQFNVHPSMLSTWRLMRVMGLEAIYCRPKTSQANPEHRKFPYLLREVTIDHPNQVWSMGITYLPMRDGFLYLAAVIDWFSRCVLAWELSNSLETSFCMEALEGALRLGKVAIFNADQGVQFTSQKFFFEGD